MRARLGLGPDRLVVAAMTCIAALALPASSLGAVPPTLTGEQVNATAGSSYFVPSTCYSGGLTDASFSFTGTATGPFPGTYTETGTLGYTLNPASSGDEIARGPIIDFSATMTITSPAGTAIVEERLAPGRSLDQDGHCYESAGGTSFETDSLAPVYLATIITARGIFQDQGWAADTLASEVALGGSVTDSSETAALTSTSSSTCHRRKAVRRRSKRRRTRLARPRRESTR